MHIAPPIPVPPSQSTRRPTTEPWLRHACLLVPVALCAAVAFAVTARTAAGAGPLPLVYAVLAAINVALLAASSMSGLLGAAVAAISHWARPSGPVAAPPTGRARTAILLPIYDEDAVRVFAAVAVMRASLSRERIGQADIFVLSDTQRPAAAAAEQDAYCAYLAGAGDGAPVHYRRRPDNSRRKTGNIAEFCERWGAAYDFMLVLDADSVMTGAAMAELVGMMEATPRAGIIQAMIYAAGRGSLFARVQQFGARLYGPLLARGVAFWQGPRGSYWGHNAIIRIAPFMAHCGLPALPGAAPLGGEVLCHDTVEAALMLRAGWDVWMAPHITGSFEETPTNLVDHLIRDRRWCQGNLQHIGLLRTSGLRLASLVHLGMGIAHYLSAPLFLGFLALSATIGTRPGTDAAQDWLLGLVVMLMFGPKLLALAATFAAPRQAAQFGGRAALVASALLDQAFGLLLGPVMVAFYTVFVATTLMGQVVRWDGQARDDRGVRWQEAVRRLALPVGAGALGAGATVMAGLDMGWMMLPGFVLGIPLAVWTGGAAAGSLARRMGLFLTPEDVTPPPELQALPVAEAILRAQAARAALPPLPAATPGRMVLQALRWPRPTPARRGAATA